MNYEQLKYRSFKDISYDSTNKINLVKSEVIAIDFDFYVQNLHVNELKSCDALYFKNENNAYLIEFKNSNVIEDNRISKIVEKYKDSIIALLSSDANYKANIKLLLVMKGDKNKNNKKRDRNAQIIYRRKLYHYFNLINQYKYDNYLKIPFVILNERAFDNQFKDEI